MSGNSYYLLKKLMCVIDIFRIKSDSFKRKENNRDKKFF